MFPYVCILSNIITLKGFNMSYLEVKKAYILVADGEFDQVCEDREQACEEKASLVAMGCTVKVKVCPWVDQDVVIGKLLDAQRP